MTFPRISCNPCLLLIISRLQQAYQPKRFILPPGASSIRSHSCCSQANFRQSLHRLTYHEKYLETQIHRPALVFKLRKPIRLRWVATRFPRLPNKLVSAKMVNGVRRGSLGDSIRRDSREPHVSAKPTKDERRSRGSMPGDSICREPGSRRRPRP